MIFISVTFAYHFLEIQIIELENIHLFVCFAFNFLLQTSIHRNLYCQLYSLFIPFTILINQIYCFLLKVLLRSCFWDWLLLPPYVHSDSSFIASPLRKVNLDLFEDTRFSLIIHNSSRNTRGRVFLKKIQEILF